MANNPEAVFEIEGGGTAAIDVEALTTLFQEHLCKGKLKFVGMRYQLSSEAATPTYDGGRRSSDL